MQIITVELQTVNVSYFQRKIQLSGFSAYPGGSSFQLIRISAVILYKFWDASSAWSLFLRWNHIPYRAYGVSLLRFIDTHTHTHTQTGRTPLDEWSARRRGHSLQNHTANTIDEKSCSQRNSKWRFQRSSGRRPTPYTAPLPELF